MERIAFIDFETTGLSPASGDRPTEIGICLISGGRVVDRFESLMNSGMRIPRDVEQLTGITNRMVRSAPPAEEVMREAFRFVGEAKLAAHNASFDRKFWDGERQRLGMAPGSPFVCTMRLSRRVFTHCTSHSLGMLKQSLQLPDTGRHHRALADAELGSHLYFRLCEEIRSKNIEQDPTHARLLDLQEKSRAQVASRVGRVLAQVFG